MNTAGRATVVMGWLLPLLLAAPVPAQQSHLQANLPDVLPDVTAWERSSGSYESVDPPGFVEYMLYVDPPRPGLYAVSHYWLRDGATDAASRERLQWHVSGRHLRRFECRRRRDGNCRWEELATESSAFASMMGELLKIYELHRTLLTLRDAGSAAQETARFGPEPSGDARLLEPTSAFWSESAPARYLVRIETSAGVFTIEVVRAWAPLGADRFYNLVRAGFYDDSRIFRVRAGYIAQFGIAGRPEVAQAWQTRSIRDDPVAQSNSRGTVAFAMTGPDTRITQVYVNLRDNGHLDDQGFAPFGRVVSGMEAVDAFYAAYGESAGGGMRGGRQGRLFEEGNRHLDTEYPSLTRLLGATIVERIE